MYMKKNHWSTGNFSWYILSSALARWTWAETSPVRLASISLLADTTPQQTRYGQSTTATQLAPGRCSAPTAPVQGVFEHPLPFNSAPGSRCKRHSKELLKLWWNYLCNFRSGKLSVLQRSSKVKFCLFSTFFDKSAHDSGTRSASSARKSVPDSLFTLFQ